MKFIPRKPRDGINVSDEHPLVEAGTLVVGLVAIFAVVALALVFFVDVALMYVSTEREARLFSSWTPEDLVPVTTDDERLDETRALLARLVRHWPDTPYNFRLEISESDIPNALALPGGLVVVTTGLLDRVETENELAFVLSHELGHFRNRDHIRGLGRGLVLMILVQAISSGQGGSTLGLNIADLATRGFGRKQESNADRFGLTIVQAEYGHVDESWRFFDRILYEDLDTSGLLTYFSTHPAAGDRIEKLKSYAVQQGWSLQGATTNLGWKM